MHQLAQLQEAVRLHTGIFQEMKRDELLGRPCEDTLLNGAFAELDETLASLLASPLALKAISAANVLKAILEIPENEGDKNGHR
jgi:hypothetical protein